VDLSFNQFIVELYRSGSRMPQPAFLTKALVSLKEWLPYQSSWLLEFNPEPSTEQPQATIKFSHGQAGKTPPPAIEIVQQLLQQVQSGQPLPMVLTQASLLSHQQHLLQKALKKSINQHYLIFFDNSTSPGQILLLLRSDPEQHFSDRDRMMAEWLLPHLCEAARLSPQRPQTSVSTLTEQPTTRSPLELHLSSDNEVIFCGEYIRACINTCENEKNCCTLDAKNDQIILSDSLIKQIQQRQSYGNITVNKLVFDIKTINNICVLRIQPESIQYLLTGRERQIASELAQGLSYKEVAKSLNLSPSTVTNYANRIYRKLNVHSKSQLAHLYTLSEAELITH
jgi:DNA-binding CsgD family transcriptional regulator